MKIHGMTHGEVTEGKEIDGFDFAVFSLCGKGEMGRKVLAQAVMAWRRLIEKHPRGIIIHVAGYDDDPRELWQIGEVREFVQKFCAKTKAHEHEALAPDSRAVLLGCGADPWRPVTVNVVSAEKAMDDFMEWLKDR
jgi:hypothetical protein